MRWPRRRSDVLLLGAALALSACPPPALPGDEHLGTYAVEATAAERACALEEVSGGDFFFDATLTRTSGSAEAFLTLASYSRAATWDGQVFTSEASARRVFAACGACSTRVEERFEVAVLSRSQGEALGHRCPPDALDGGVPAPDADAGLLLPRATALGFDAVRLCGALTTRVVAEGTVDGGACEPQCGACTVRWRLTGERR